MRDVDVFQVCHHVLVLVITTDVFAVALALLRNMFLLSELLGQ